MCTRGAKRGRPVVRTPTTRQKRPICQRTTVSEVTAVCVRGTRGAACGQCGRQPRPKMWPYTLTVNTDPVWRWDSIHLVVRACNNHVQTQPRVSEWKGAVCWDVLGLCATILLSDAAVRGRGARGCRSGTIQSTVHLPTQSRASEEREGTFGRPCMQTTPASVHATTTFKDVSVRTTVTEVGATCAKGARGAVRSDAVSAHVGENHVRGRGRIHLLPVRQRNKRWLSGRPSSRHQGGGLEYDAAKGVRDPSVPTQWVCARQLRPKRWPYTSENETATHDRPGSPLRQMNFESEMARWKSDSSQVGRIHVPQCACSRSVLQACKFRSRITQHYSTLSCVRCRTPGCPLDLIELEPGLWGQVFKIGLYGSCELKLSSSQVAARWPDTGLSLKESDPEMVCVGMDQSLLPFCYHTMWLCQLGSPLISPFHWILVDQPCANEVWAVNKTSGVKINFGDHPNGESFVDPAWA